MRKAIVIHDTKFGNTEKVAKALGLGMKERGIEVNCFKVGEVQIDKLTGYDLVVIGGPTHKLGLSEPMKDFLGKLEHADLRGKKAFVFDTRLKIRFAGSAGKRIEKELRRLRMSVVRPYSSAIVKGREGPLEEGVDEMFKQIAAEITKSIQ